ncbi:WD repeat and FYVE domain-containing protein 3 [Acropora cervicornis]|uniref:WD repeat and FYVE domain-containing protein 3 n=1 Tax=Acropora cervicornis TaxID=6130 RepID=A0AAD9UVH4_ACRCE|nr:WD repeat and FYVE domain-containing protein 3 [Acropora cervicornis]
MIEGVKGQNVSLESGYHSLNRTILFQLSRPLARLTDQTSLLEFLHILTTNHKLLFASVNNEPEFIAGLCHWLLVMGTHKFVEVSEKTSEELEPEVATAVSLEEESSCSRLLAAAAERVWDIFLRNKREAIDDAFKISLPKPSFTSYKTMDYVEHMMWLMYISNEEKHKIETLGHLKQSISKKHSLRMLSTKKTKKETRDLKALLNDSHRWRMQHTKVVRDLVRLHHKNHLQNYQLISKSVAEEWALMDADLTRERGLWGPPCSSQLDKWALDMVEGIKIFLFPRNR